MRLSSLIGLMLRRGSPICGFDAGFGTLRFSLEFWLGRRRENLGATAKLGDREAWGERRAVRNCELAPFRG